MKRLTILAVALTLSTCSGNLLLDFLPETRVGGAPAPAPTLQEIYMRGIWVVGGLTGDGPHTVVGQVDVFDPVTSTWYPNVTTLPTPVSFAGVVGFQGRLFVIGGFNNGGIPQSMIQIYDIRTNTWLPGGGSPMPPPARANINAVVAGGFIYVLGGTTAAATAPWAGAMTTLRYNIQGNDWIPRTNFAAAAHSNLIQFGWGGNLYFLGGRSAAATLVTAHDAYVPIPLATDFLTTGTTEVVMTAARTGSVADVFRDSSGVTSLIVVGGVTAMTGTTGNYAFLATTTYTPTNMVQFLPAPFTAGATWITAPPAQNLPLALGYGAGLIANGVFYFFGGTNTGTTTPLVPAVGSSTLYHADLSAFPTTFIWTTGPTMPVGRFGHSVVRSLP